MKELLTPTNVVLGINVVALVYNAGMVRQKLKQMERVIMGNGNVGLADKVAGNSRDLAALRGRCEARHPGS